MIFLGRGDRVGNGWIGLWGFLAGREMMLGRIGGKGEGGGGKDYEDGGISLMACMHGYGGVMIS